MDKNNQRNATPFINTTIILLKKGIFSLISLSAEGRGQGLGCALLVTPPEDRAVGFSYPTVCIAPESKQTNVSHLI